MSQVCTTLPNGTIHALRTPLAALQAAIDVFALPGGGPMRAEAEDIARRQVRRLTELVTELDGFHRLQRMADGDAGDGPTTLRLAPMLAQAWEQVAAKPDGLDGARPVLPAVPPSLQVRSLPEALQPGLVALLRHAARHALPIQVDARVDRVRLHAGAPPAGLSEAPRTPPAPEAAPARPLGGGLELLRRLAQAAGGGLRLDPSDPDGGFCLELPLAPDGGGTTGRAG